MLGKGACALNPHRNHREHKKRRFGPLPFKFPPKSNANKGQDTRAAVSTRAAQAISSSRLPDDVAAALGISLHYRAFKVRWCLPKIFAKPLGKISIRSEI